VTSKYNHHAKCLILSSILFFFSFTPNVFSQQSDLAKSEALNRQANRLYDQRHYAQAIPLALDALYILEKTYGQEDPKLSSTLYLLFKSYNRLGNKTVAAQYYSRNLVIYEKTHDLLNSDTNFKRNRLAKLYVEIGDYAKAEPLLRKSLSVREKNLGPDHPNVAHALNKLARLYHKTGNYPQAELLYMRALAIREKKLGPEHIDVGVSLNNLAALFFELGDYRKAELLYKRALPIWLKKLGPNHPNMANIQNNIAELYRAIGDYEQADAYFQRSLDILEKAQGPPSLAEAATLNNQAELYRALGHYARAEALYKKALAITATIYGRQHVNYGTSLSNLALLYYDMGDYRQAELLFIKVQSIWENTLEPGHSYLALNLNNLATLYLDKGDYDRAEPLFQRALAINKKALGKAHPQVATILNNMAQLNEFKGNYTKATQLYNDALVIYERALGPEHPDVSMCLNNLAALQVGTGSLTKGLELHFRAQDIDRKLIEQVMGFTSEDRKMKFLATKMGSLNIFISQVLQHMQNNPSARKKAFNVWLGRKGVVLQAQRRFQEALAYSNDPRAVKTFQKLASVRARLSKLAFEGPGKEGIEVYRKQKAALEVEKDKLEAKLSRLSQAFALKKKIAKADDVTMAKVLPLNTVLLDFARVAMFNFKEKGNEKGWLPAHYVVFVLHSGEGDQVAMIDLGEADKIDKTVNRFKKQIYDEKDLKRKGRRLHKTAQRLYTLVFEPIKKELGDVKEIFVSPDGNLNLIPFEVLQTPDGRFLIEDFTFNYLAAGRDVLAFGEIKEKGGKSLIVGDPDFDMGDGSKNIDSDTNRGVTAMRSVDMNDLFFKRLPDTKKEVVAILKLLGKKSADLCTNKEASETALFTRQAPKFLHLATHGFFLNDQDMSALKDSRAIGVMDVNSSQPIKRAIKIENPLLRSGIALAGEILGLRLRGTDMVVLSACETGLGEVKSGEGVFGLRRAFIQAGTKSLVMSMWQVPDKETRELMIQFYKNIQSGMSRGQALRQAALKQKAIIAERYGHSHPFYWGAFVFLGEP